MDKEIKDVRTSSIKAALTEVVRKLHISGIQHTGTEEQHATAILSNLAFKLSISGNQDGKLKWIDLYDKRWRVYKAWFAKRVLRLPTRLKTVSWYHILLGYRQRIQLVTEDPFYEELVSPTFELEDAIDKHVRVEYWFELLSPVDKKLIDISISMETNCKDNTVEVRYNKGDPTFYWESRKTNIT